ncbi:MAG: copper chaperone PCu(A)C [Burkholderiaceae bacterium]|nr:copper chaperone PCu(A)C [Burkholderiaceae bacterium]
MAIKQGKHDPRAWLTLVLGLCLAFSVRAQPVVAEQAWARATVPNQTASGAFMRLTAKQDVTLIGARSPDASVVEVHEMKIDDGIMRMRPVGAVPIKAGQTIELKSGGYHLMMMDLKRQLKSGDAVALTLEFKSADGRVSTVDVKATARLTPPGP